MEGYFGNVHCSQVGTSVIVSRTAIINEINSGIEARLIFDNFEADALEARLRELRLARTPSVVAECIDLTAATGPVRPLDIEEVSARR